MVLAASKPDVLVTTYLEMTSQDEFTPSFIQATDMPNHSIRGQSDFATKTPSG